MTDAGHRFDETYVHLAPDVRREIERAPQHDPPRATLDGKESQ